MWDGVTCVPNDIGGRKTLRINTREQTFRIFHYLAHRPSHILLWQQCKNIFCVHCKPILIRSNKMQQYAGIYLLQKHSTCFGCPSHPSSGVHKIVTAASGTGHITYLSNNLPTTWPIGHRNSILIRSNKMQQYAGIYVLQKHSTCFGCPSHPSSGVHKTVTAAPGTGHSIWETTFLQRGL